MDLGSLLALLAIVVSVVTFAITTRRSIRKDREAALDAAAKAQKVAIADAVKAATDPLVAQLTERTRERDYLRERCDDLQDQLNRRPAK